MLLFVAAFALLMMCIGSSPAINGQVDDNLIAAQDQDASSDEDPTCTLPVEEHETHGKHVIDQATTPYLVLRYSTHEDIHMVTHLSGESHPGFASPEIQPPNTA